MDKLIEANYIKVKAPKRAPESVLRRTDFNYLGGHGTFYKITGQYVEDVNKKLLGAKLKDHISLVMHNMHTDQLDEVRFELTESYDLNQKCKMFIGHIDDIEDYFEIKIEYFPEKPLNTDILVYASAPSLI